MKHSLDEVYNQLETQNICVFDCALDHNLSICSPDGYIGINERQLNTTSEKRTVLLHEAGHFISGAFYKPFSPFVIREQAEYRANKAAIKQFIQKVEIDSCVESGITELWELSEHFNVTEDFMLNALLFYKSQEYEAV